MKASYDREKKDYEFTAKTVKGMLKELGIVRNAVIVVVNGEVVTEDYTFKEKDTVKILSVVSGG